MTSLLRFALNRELKQWEFKRQLKTNTVSVGHVKNLVEQWRAPQFLPSPFIGLRSKVTKANPGFNRFHLVLDQGPISALFKFL